MHIQKMSGRTTIAVLAMFICFVLIALTQKARSLPHASIIPAQEVIEGMNKLTLPTGQHLLLSPDADYAIEKNTLVVRRGTALMHAPAHGTVMTHAARVDLFGATAYIVAEKNHTTIAALRGPVLVRSHRAVIVPEGMQMVVSAESDSMKKQLVPPFWLAEQHGLLNSADQNYALQTQDDVLRALSHADEKSLATYTAFRLLLELQESDVQTLLLKTLEDDDVMDDLAMSIVQSALSIARPLPEILVLFTEKELSKRLVGSPQETLRDTIPLITRLTTTLQEKGYPRSAQQWSNVEDRLMALGMPFVSPQERAAFMPPQSSSASSTGAIVMEAVPLHPRDAERMARNIILESGFLFTVETTFSPIAERPGIIRVENLQYAGTWVHTMSLSLDVTTNNVSSIVLDGRALPNELTLDAFIASL